GHYLEHHHRVSRRASGEVPHAGARSRRLHHHDHTRNHRRRGRQLPRPSCRLVSARRGGGLHWRRGRRRDRVGDLPHGGFAPHGV
ncbi:MAG: Transglycosylase-associated protein, partial [uncultured Acetobacteraceae bacterium]